MSVTEKDGTLREPPHPLTVALVEAVVAQAEARVAASPRVLLLGAGNGRHLPVLLQAGFAVEAVEPEALRAGTSSLTRPSAAAPNDGALFSGALSTHALLHGRPPEIAAMLAQVRSLLHPGAPFYFTLGSTRDARFERGTCIDDATWAPTEGSESGVAHAYFDERAARELLGDWKVDSLDEHSAHDTAGRWAHTDAELATLVHWFVRARRPL